MKKVFSILFGREQIRFVIVGFLNTVIGTTVMFIAYHCGLGYWISTALNYIVGSIFSYLANKYFTFKSHGKEKGELYRFVINILVCYLIAYGIAKPIVSGLVIGIKMEKQIIEQISMIFGMCFFVLINYCGQKFFVFRMKYSNGGN